MRAILILLLLGCARCFAQYDQSARNAFMEADVQAAFDYWSISKPSARFHTSFRPYLSSTFRNATDSGMPFRIYRFRNQFFGKVFNEKPEKRNWYNLQAHPLAMLEAGYDARREQVLSTAAGGAHIKLNINDDFTFAVTAIGGNMQLPYFLDTVVRKLQVLPEFGQAYKSRNNAGYDFFDWQGYVSYSPRNNGIFNFQAGRDRHFIGDGYRSVLLSDFAPAYPFFRINTNVWRIQYNVWYTWMYDVASAAMQKNRYRNKFGTFHYLSWNVVKGLSVGVFENVIWRGTDTNQVRSFDVNYLNPVILYRPVEYSLGSPDNSFLGLNLSYSFLKKIRLYAQIGLDEFYLRELRARRGWWANKQAWQLGAKHIHAFGLKGLTLQAEYNQVRPYTYSHGVPDQNYAHYGMPLAHPLGANFKEALGFVSLRRNRLLLSMQLMYAVAGRDSSARSNVGQNISLSYVTRPFEYGHYTGQGNRTEVLQWQLKFAYFLVPDMNLRAEIGILSRSEQGSGGSGFRNPYLYASLRSGIWNSYRDY